MILNMVPTSFFPKEEADEMRKALATEIVDVGSLDDIQDSLNDVDAVITGWNITAEDIDRLPNLKWIQSFSAGVNTFPMKKIEERGIILTNTSGVHAPQMSGHIMGMILAFSRGILPSIRSQKEKKWTSGLEVSELTGKELLIVGAGSIGAELARKAKAFDMIVVGLKRTVQLLKNYDEVRSMNELDEAMSTADYVVILAPLTKDTRGMIGYKQLSCMKKEAILINLGRGPLVVEKDLIRILKEKKIKGAGLDVFSKEPLPEDSPLWNFDNVIITPHIGGFSDLSTKRTVKFISENIHRFDKGEKLKNIISLELGY